MASTIFLYKVLILCCVLTSCAAKDAIMQNESISDGETLVSAGEVFELGFFSPEGNSSSLRYVGIWYYRVKPQTVVWVANRDEPLPDSTGVLSIKDGNLFLTSNGCGKSFWSTGSQNSVSTNKVVVRLMDSGNLVLSDDQFETTLWQSFQHPAHTFLPGMEMDENLVLTSWKSEDDPATGYFTFRKDRGGQSQYIIRRKDTTYWKSGVSEKFLRSETNNEKFPMVVDLLPLSSNNTQQSSDSYKIRLVMTYLGEIQYLIWDNMTSWSVFWREPEDRCSLYNACGNFGSCNSGNQLLCKCLPGFQPKFPRKWSSGNFLDGCRRISPICKEEDIFLSLKMMRIQSTNSEFPKKDLDECRDHCTGDRSCQAYAFITGKNRTENGTCMLWPEEVKHIQEEYKNGGRDVYVRVAKSDIESTVRTCKTCGTLQIPYPLSTGSDCGDPMYSGFRCNEDTGQVWFNVTNGSYRVASIAPKKSNFLIQVTDNNTCEQRGLLGRTDLQLKLPFRLTSWCRSPTGTSSGMSMEGIYEIEISWDPPLEPVCNSSKDCKGWPNSDCRTKDQTARCLCNQNFRWNSSSLNCTQDRGNDAGPPSRASFTYTLSVVGMTVGGVVILLSCAIAYIAFFGRRANSKRRGNRSKAGRRLYDSQSRVKHLMDSEQFEDEDKEGIDVPFFDLEDILAATDDFSDENKLGRGGFGPVYKGKFPEGGEIAVKRLSKASGQGLQEFKNEAVLIAKLQHRNLVRLLGYCIEGDEKILLYEYMPNKSLDSFVFDGTRSLLLNWEKRFDIILGIARGLLYLHQDSRLKIIHRDLKTSNILLDDEMNPKISDFGLARIFDSKQVEASTSRVMGTYGYMAPEYALDGFYSEKSDVFSFGVMILEIISGKRNTGFYQSDRSLSLLGHAWKLWREENVLDLVDQTASETCNKNELLRCLNVGLLCVQEDPSDRPTMALAVLMLSGETATLPMPNTPAFVARRDLSSTASSSSKPTASLSSDLLATIEEGRQSSRSSLESSS